MEGSRFPQTTVIYHCSNETCQKEKDKQTAARIKQREGKDIIDAERAAKKLEQKHMKQKSRAGDIAA